MSPVRVELTVFLELNKHVIPGLNKVLVNLHGSKEERKANADATVAAKNSVSGDISVLSQFPSLVTSTPIPIPFK